MAAAIQTHFVAGEHWTDRANPVWLNAFLISALTGVLKLDRLQLGEDRSTGCVNDSVYFRLTWRFRLGGAGAESRAFGQFRCQCRALPIVVLWQHVYFAV